MTEAWDRLTAELDRWQADGAVARFWWRDDDAVEPTAALDRLLSIAAGTGTPVALAVIPADVTADLPPHLGQRPVATVVQHGWSHHNHAPPGRKKAELGDDRPVDTVLDDLRRGQDRLDTVFGPQGWLRMLVPPWNRISPGVRNGAGGLGFTAVSTYGPRRTVPGPVQVNTHIDIMDWKGTRGFAGADACIEAAVATLGAQRLAGAGVGDAVGLLTHHLVHDDACWSFIEEFAIAIDRHPAAAWVAPSDLLSPV